MNTDKNLPVNMIIVEPTVIDGKHVAVGTVIKNCETELAMDLAGSGKARPSTPELVEEYKKRIQNQQAADNAVAEAKEKLQAEQANANSDALAKVIGSAIASALAAQQPAKPPATA